MNEQRGDYFKKYSARGEGESEISAVLYPGVITVASFHVPEVAPSKIEVSNPMLVFAISKCRVGFESQGTLKWFFVAIREV